MRQNSERPQVAELHMKNTRRSTRYQTSIRFAGHLDQNVGQDTNTRIVRRRLTKVN